MDAFRRSWISYVFLILLFLLFPHFLVFRDSNLSYAETFAGRIGIGLEGIGGRGLEFVDAIKTASRWEAIGEGPLPTDQDGWPLADFKVVVFDLRPTFA